MKTTRECRCGDKALELIEGECFICNFPLAAPDLSGLEAPEVGPDMIRRMHASGMAVTRICKELGLTSKVVRGAIDEKAYHAWRRHRDQLQRAAYERRTATPCP